MKTMAIALAAARALLALYLHRSAPPVRHREDSWVSVGLPRFVALSLLNRIGIARWNDLPVLRLGLDEAIKGRLTCSYSYTLAMAFQAHEDYQGDIRGGHQAMQVLGGSEDKWFDASQYEATIVQAGRKLPVTMVPGVNPMGLTLDRRAMPAIIDAAAGHGAPPHQDLGIAQAN